MAEDFNIVSFKALSHFQNELKQIKTGRANVQMLDGIMVEAYGSRMPLNQVATITVQDATMLLVSPWDKTLVEAIQKAISTSRLGINPIVDANSIRIPIPPLTEETRKMYVKEAQALAENAKISIRQLRKEYMERIDKEKVSDDQGKVAEKKLQLEVDGVNTKIEEVLKAKEEQIMQI